MSWRTEVRKLATRGRERAGGREGPFPTPGVPLFPQPSWWQPGIRCHRGRLRACAHAERLQYVPGPGSCALGGCGFSLASPPLGGCAARGHIPSASAADAAHARPHAAIMRPRAFAALSPNKLEAARG